MVTASEIKDTPRHEPDKFRGLGRGEAVRGGGGGRVIPIMDFSGRGTFSSWMYTKG